MDNNQNTQASSAPLQVGSPIPSGATIGNSLQVGGPIPRGATIGNPTSDEIQVNPEDNIATKAAKYAEGGLEGVGEGVFKTAAGATDIFGGKGTGFSNELHSLAGDNNVQHGGAQQVGQGLETIGEFLLGDEALKGLSVADKLTQVSKVMKFIEKSPRLAQALRMGINVGKAGTELTQEERAVLAAHPVLARLAGVGLDALRQGAVQTVQTGIKNPEGNNALESGAEMAGGSAALGAPLAAVGGVLAKGGEAAQNAEALRNAAQTTPTANEANTALQNTVEGKVNPQIEAAQAVKTEAEEKLAGAGSVLSNVTAPTKQEIAKNAESFMKTAHDNLSGDYIQAANKVKGDLAGETIDYNDTPINQTVKDLLGESEKNKEYLPAKFKAPTPLTPNTQAWLAKNFEHYGEDLVKGEDGKEEWVPKPTPLTAEDLIDSAKQVKHNIRTTSFTTPEGRADRDAYFSLLDGIHESLQDLAEKAGKPEAYDALQQANAEYKAGVQRFENPDVKSLFEGNNENAIIRTLSGGKSAQDIQTIRDTIGNKAFASLSDDAMSKLAADARNPTTGEFDMKRWISSMNAIPNDVRQAMVNGTTKGGALENIFKQVQAVNASGVIPNSEASIKDSEKLMTGILGNTPDLLGMLKSPEKVDALSKLVGPDAMGELGNTILQNQLREAATRGNAKISTVDTNQFLRFVGSLKDSPEVVDDFFKPTPERAAAYDKLLQSVHNVEGVKNMVKLGILAPAIGTTAALGSTGHWILSTMLGSLALEQGIAGYFRTASTFLDQLANSPKTWGALKALSNIPKSSIAKGTAYLGKVAAGKYVAPKLVDILKNTNSQLSNQ